MTWSNSQYYYNTTSTNTGTWVYPAISAGSSSVTFGESYAPVAPAAPHEPTPLEWLDAEVERTCAKARLAA